MEPDISPPNMSAIESALSNLTLHSSNTSEATTTAITLLASSSRTDPSTREKLANPQILEILIQTIECSINDSLETVEVALRCLGNACIDNDEAKAELTRRGFGWAKLCLPPVDADGEAGSINDLAIEILTMKVLYNICTDNASAQRRCFEEKIHYAIIPVFGYRTESQTPTPEEIALFVELLFNICTHLDPEQHYQPPSNVLRALLKLPELYKDALDTEDFALLIETCLLFLREAGVQKDVIKHKLLRSVWMMLEVNERNVGRLQIDDNDARRVVVPLSAGVIWVLSDLAALRSFPVEYPLNDDFVQTVLIPTIVHGDGLILIPATPRLVDAACQVLGNLLWSMEPPLPYEQIDSLRYPLTERLAASEDEELLHSAAGLLIQLSRLSPDLREALGLESSTRLIVTRLCRHHMPQLKQDGIALLRVLGKDSLANQQRFADLARDLVPVISSDDLAMAET